jgi:hypothetical protein
MATKRIATKRIVMKRVMDVTTSTAGERRMMIV